MRITSILAGKKKLDLISGLIWHPLRNTGSARTKEIRTFAKESSFDFQVLRGTDPAHIGFAKKSDGAKAGQISSAAVIAQSLAVVNGKRNFLFAVALPDDPLQYMFVSAHQGVILVDGDIVGSAEDIRMRLTQDATYGGWGAIICPSSWGVPKSIEKSFSYFFNEKSLKTGEKWAIKETKFDSKKVLLPAVVLLILVGAGLYGTNLWKVNQAFKLEEMRLLKEKMLKSQEAPPVQAVKPWPAMLKPAPFVAACAEAYAHVGVTAGNWRLKSIDCTTGGLSITWSKPNEMAWVSHLKQIRPEAKISEDGLTASINEPLRFKADADELEELPAADGINLPYFDTASRYAMSITLSPPLAPPAPVTLPGQESSKAPVVVPPFWVEIPVRIETLIDPVKAIGLVSQTGLRIQKISYAITTGPMQYTLTGVQYARR